MKPRILKGMTGALLLSVASIFQVSAQGVDSGRDKNLDELTFTQMLAGVETGKTSDLIKAFQEKEARSKLTKTFGKTGLNLETCRNREVIVITIPADKLFAPNDIELLPGAGEYFKPITRYLKTPDMYRVLLVMHTDNTGSDVYREEVTTDRVESVFDWFENSGVNTDYLFSYAMADDMPLVPNTSMENRASNRRLEIYLVPGTAMIEQAKKGRIEY